MNNDNLSTLIGCLGCLSFAGVLVYYIANKYILEPREKIIENEILYNQRNSQIINNRLYRHIQLSREEIAQRDKLDELLSLNHLQEDDPVNRLSSTQLEALAKPIYNAAL